MRVPTFSSRTSAGQKTRESNFLDENENRVTAASGLVFVLDCFSLELLLFGGALHRQGRCRMGTHYGCHVVEVPGSDEGLVLDRGVSFLLGHELLPLEFDVCLHPLGRVPLRQ